MTTDEFKESLIEARKHRRTEAAERNEHNARMKHLGALEGLKRADDFAAQSDEQVLDDAGSWRTFRRDMARTICDHQDYALAPASYDLALKVLRYICTRCNRKGADGLRLSEDEIASGVGYSKRYVRTALSLLQGHRQTVYGTQVNGKRPRIEVRGIVDDERGGPPLTVRDGGSGSNVYFVNRAVVLAESYLTLRV